jgi:hypothetical protein
MLALVSVLTPFEDSGRATEGPGRPTFVVHTAEGANIAGTLEKLAEDWSLRLVGERPILVSGRDVVSLRRTSVPLPDYPETNVVILSHGDRLPVDPAVSVMLDEGRLRFQLLLTSPQRQAKGVEEIKVPLAYVALLWFKAPATSPQPDVLMNKLLNGQRAHDVVLLRSGDVIEGSVTGIDRERGCRVESGPRKLAVELAKVSAIAFNSELRASLRPRGPFAHVVVASGGRLSFQSLQLDPATHRLKGKTLFGPRLEIPLEQAVSLTPRQAQVVYLSDLKPREYVHTPYLGVSWPLAVDKAVTGSPLRLAGNTFDKGLGMHSRSRVTYALGGAYRWFETQVGLDERRGRRGRVRIQVLVDGKEQNLGADKELPGAQMPLTLRVDIRKARDLTLIVDFAGFGDVQGHVDWADARLIR